MKNEHITDFRSKHTILVEPMTEKELKENMRKDGSISAKVLINFFDLVNNDIEWLNDEVSEKVTNSVCSLVDMNYSVAGRTTNNQVIVKVNAVVEFDYL